MSERGPSGPHVALVETSDVLPGLLPFQSWDVLGTADVVLVRDRERHPSVPHLYMAGLDLEQIEPAQLERADLDLTRPGAPDDRRIAKTLLARARERRSAVYLLGPDDGGVAPALAGMSAEHGVEIELVFLAQQPAGTELLRLVDVMRQLRSPDDGCPWDLEQDHRSLLRHLVEETYELVDAIEEGDDAHLQEELGDVLLQIVFHAQIAMDRRAFGIDEVARGISDKLVRRHPHVFGDGDAVTAEQVQANWDELKSAEKQRATPFEGVPDAAPGLELLAALQRKAATHRIDWPDDRPASDRALDALDAIRSQSEGAEVEVHLGALLAAATELARDHDVDPEVAARAAARRFRAHAEQRFLEQGGEEPV